MAKIIDITKKNSHQAGNFNPAAEIVALAGAYEGGADILYCYAEAVEELLPQMAELMEVNVSDFVLEKGSLISLDRDMKQGGTWPHRLSCHKRRYGIQCFNRAGGRRGGRVLLSYPGR